MMARTIALAIAALFLCNKVAASDRELTPADIAKVKCVCRSLIGVPEWRPYEVFRSKLASYALSKQALEQSSIVVCSGACGGGLALRGNADIYYGYPNPVGERHYVDTVVLHVHGKCMLSLGPGKNYYPYPYYEKEHKKR